MPRIFGRPFELKPGQGLSQAQLVQRLNDVGYAQRPNADGAGEFGVTDTSVLVVPRSGERGKPTIVRVEFARPNARRSSRGSRASAASRLNALRSKRRCWPRSPPGERRRYVPLASIPRHMVDAVLAIEDRRFYDHPGVDPIGIVARVHDEPRGDKPYLVGGSTLTQQIVKNTFLTPAKTLQPQAAGAVHGARPRVAVHQGPDPRAVPERRRARPARAVRDPWRLRSRARSSSARTSATSRWPKRRRSPASSSRRRGCRPSAIRSARGNAATSCSQAMADGGFVTPSSRRQGRARSRSIVASRALENEAPYFVDYVSQLVDEKYGGLLKQRRGRRRLHDARPAPAAARAGSARRGHGAGGQAARRAGSAAARRRPRSSPSIRAPARSSRWSAAAPTTSRSTTARSSRGGSPARSSSRSCISRRSRRWPRRADRPHAGDHRHRRADDVQGRREGLHAGQLPERVRRARSRCAARWRSRATSSPIKVAETVGYDRVASAVEADRRRHVRRKRVSVDRARRLRSLAARDDRGLHALHQRRHRSGRFRRVIADRRGRQDPQRAEHSPTRSVARPDTTYLVTNMMRSVINEGTGAGARAAGLRARRRRQVRHDQRPARRLVHRLHAGAAHGRLGRLRRQPADRAERVAGRAADLDGVHEAGAGRPPEHRVRGPRGHRVRRHRHGDRAAGDAAAAREVIQRGVPRREQRQRKPARSTAAGVAGSIFSRLGGLFRRMIR